MNLECSLSPELSQLLSTARGLHFGFDFATAKGDKPPKSPGHRPSVIVSYISGSAGGSRKDTGIQKGVGGQSDKSNGPRATSRKKLAGDIKRPTLAIEEFESSEGGQVEEHASAPPEQLNFDPKKVLEYVSSPTNRDRGALWIDGASAARHDIAWEPHTVGTLKAPPPGSRSQLKDNRGTALRSPPNSARDGILIRVVDDPGPDTAAASMPSSGAGIARAATKNLGQRPQSAIARTATTRLVQRAETQGLQQVIQGQTTALSVPQVSTNKQPTGEALPSRQRPSSAANHGQRLISSVHSGGVSRNETPTSATNLPWRRSQGSAGTHESGGVPVLTEVSCCRWGSANVGGKRQLLRAAVPCEGEISNLIHEVQRRGNPTARHRPPAVSANTLGC